MAGENPRASKGKGTLKRDWKIKSYWIIHDFSILFWFYLFEGFYSSIDVSQPGIHGKDLENLEFDSKSIIILEYAASFLTMIWIWMMPTNNHGDRSRMYSMDLLKDHLLEHIPGVNIQVRAVLFF